MNVNMEDIKRVAMDAAGRAGHVLMELFQQDMNYKMKSSHDIVTEGDFASEKIILDAIKENFPDHSILSEEDGETEKSSEYLWVVDPVDGTINFSRGFEEFCISIGVLHNGVTIFGLIYQPALEKVFMAVRGEGAFVNGKKLHVSSEKELINMMAMCETTSKVEKRVLQYGILHRICKQFRAIRMFGSGALHLTKLAGGGCDVYFNNRFNFWDYAAGILLIEEAGGTVTDFSGGPITRNSENIVATNGKCHEEVLKLVNG